MGINDNKIVNRILRLILILAYTGLVAGIVTNFVSAQSIELKPSFLIKNHNLVKLTTQESPSVAQQISGLKNTVNILFTRQGIFAGQDQVGNPDYNYQRWQVPLIIGTLINVNQDYLGSFADFLPKLAPAGNFKYGSYNNLLEVLYQVNNWDTFSSEQRPKICKLSGYCFLIDDRLWWVNAFISYANNLRAHNSHDPQIKSMLAYAYRIFVYGISNPRYVNTKGTPHANSVMWHSDFNHEPYYKSTISNSLYVTAGARLAKLINQVYGKSDHNYSYKLVLKNTRLVADGYFLNYSRNLKSDGLLLDGVGTGAYTAAVAIQDYPLGTVANAMYTYNQGVVLPGMAILNNLTHKPKYLVYAKSLVKASYKYAQSYNGFFDDYSYTKLNGWFADSDGIAFRLAYWQYLGLFLENYALNSDREFTNLLHKFINENAKQIVVRDLTLPDKPNVVKDFLASPNHNNLIKPQQGKLFTYYPDGYSVPGIGAALELLVLQQRINYYYFH